MSIEGYTCEIVAAVDANYVRQEHEILVIDKRYRKLWEEIRCDNYFPKCFLMGILLPLYSKKEMAYGKEKEKKKKEKKSNLSLMVMALSMVIMCVLGV